MGVTNINAPIFTPTMQRVISLADIEARKTGSYVGVYHILVGIMLEGDNGGQIMLEAAGFTADSLRHIRISAKGEVKA